MKSEKKQQPKRVRIPRFQGVYYRDSQSDTRRHNGKPDRCFDICYRNPKGKLVWEKVGWASEGYSAAAAATIRAERLRSIRHGDEIVQRKDRQPTFGDLWERYDAWLDTGKRQPRDDRSTYRNHLQCRFEHKLLSQITPLDLETMKDELLKKGLAPATVKHVLVLVRQMMNKAKAWKLWNGENPIKEVKLPKLNNRRERFLSPEEADQLLEEISKGSDQLHDITLLSLHTGMRAGEIFNLQWVHVDIQNGLIHVADSRSGRARKAYMTDSVKRMFMERGPGSTEELVFKSTNGQKIMEVSNAFAAVVKRLGFNDGIKDARQKVTFHSLRHTFASWLALQGYRITTIKELLGHASLAMTERYAHLNPDHSREAIEGIERMFRSGMPSREDNVTSQDPQSDTKPRR